ncbi:ABC transporter ATP-binding protein, partial [Escherichia coli]|nr:ABC transporter ATP-binding protein [Escherichia coli]
AGFADIGTHLDQPVKTYSSGMMVRLAFAVQVQLEPDILIVDEALAVGDALFQKRCFQQIEKLTSNGVTLLFVSHDQESVRTLTNR